jgi:hypothetical protein
MYLFGNVTHGFHICFDVSGRTKVLLNSFLRNIEVLKYLAERLYVLVSDHISSFKFAFAFLSGNDGNAICTV